ncbi:DUF1513 domain-containing protein [Limnobacter parvus]|uniref:DUF1513 domain-containing protein n=1 Tax=Limnobacter parvus TaxID=2939690 RepID=A0ABT1XHD4_9BURK|nr:DUF1513 domain-containing protein [Limnobacter parvus]
MNRRAFLAAAGGATVCMAMPLARAVTPLRLNDTKATLLAAWQQASGNYQAGILELQPHTDGFFEVQWAIDLPTRPHGLMHFQGDDYLVIARRPGDWLMQLNLHTRTTQRTWQDSGRHLNGHSAVCGKLLFTAETDLLTGHGALGVRDRATLKLLDVWPTHGHDPHELLVLPQGCFGITEPCLLVANGGIQTHADMGRTQLSQSPMDSSLVAIHASTGKLLKQWTLDDSRLSLRHLVQHQSGVLGIAMQAHHNTEKQRDAAPVLAMLSHGGLKPVPASTHMKGYAGDIAATPEGFVVSCTQSNVVLHVDTQGRRLGITPADAACALASSGNKVWLGHKPALSKPAIELDNHWIVLES